MERKYLFRTVLAKALIPFAVLKTERLFLPVRHDGNGYSMMDSKRLIESGDHHAAEWMKTAEEHWERDRQSDDRSLHEWLNYNQKLTKQDPRRNLLVLYNTSGTNLAAALVMLEGDRPPRFGSTGFVAESVTYYYYPRSEAEGDYIVAVLNSNLVNDAIKEFQPQGLFGERHIHRRPFEVCSIPKFDDSNPIHSRLAELGKKCREEIAPFVDKFNGRVGQVRLAARDILKNEIVKIDSSVRQLLLEEGQNLLYLANERKQPSNGSLFPSSSEE